MIILAVAVGLLASVLAFISIYMIWGPVPDEILESMNPYGDSAETVRLQMKGILAIAVLLYIAALYIWTH